MHGQQRIHVSGCTRNQVLPKRIFAVPDYKGSKHNLLSLSLKLVFREWVAAEVQHPPARCLEAKPLVASKMTVSLKVPDDLVSSVNENGHILPTHSAVELAQIVCSISGPGDEELSQLADSVPLLHFEGASISEAAQYQCPLHWCPLCQAHVVVVAVLQMASD